VPEEAWTGIKLDVSHIRIFGYVAYAHIPNKLRQKLDNKSEKCIFLGYSDQSKVYLLYNPITRKVVISRDMKFAKEEAWNGSIQVVGVEHIDGGVNPTHAPPVQNYEHQGVAVPKEGSSSGEQAPTTSTSESSIASLRR